MSKKCPKCESKDIHITEYPNPTDSMATCYGCGHTDLVEQFPKTVFDRITQSPETLAGRLVYFGTTSWDDDFWASTICDGCFDTKAEAIAATVAMLKEVAE